jgi:hypothetical protein
MAIGDHIRIITEEECRIMSPPRRPRGEKPATTIRYLQRQIANLQASCAMYRNAVEEKDKQIARDDVEKGELATELHQAKEAAVRQRIDFAGQRSIFQAQERRLAYLEGYHARTQELLPHDPAKTHRGAGAGDTQNLQDGRQGGETPRQETGPARSGQGTGGEIRRRGTDHSARPERRPVEGMFSAAQIIEMAENEEDQRAHDATESQLTRHRR